MDDTRHSGFTLLELLVTLAIIGLLAGLAVPAMATFIDSARLRTAAEALARELREARSYSLSTAQPVYFQVRKTSADQWCFGWSTRSSCDCDITDPSADTACVTSRNVAVQPNQSTSGQHPFIQLTPRLRKGSSSFSFTPVRGTATAGSIGLSNKQGELRIIVSPLGRIRICSPQARRYPKC